MILKFTMVALYLLVLLGIGLVASRRVKDVKDYFAAGKSLGFMAAAFSSRATGESAWLLLGLTGMGAALGIKAFWVVFGELLGVAASWLLMSRRFHRLTQRYDSITVPDYLEERFRDRTHRLRLVAATALVVFVTIYVSAQIDATGKAFESFLGVDYYVGATVGYAVVLGYIALGGFLAVVWSDVFQGRLMVLGLVLLPIVGLISLGGFDVLFSKLEAIDPSLLAWSGSVEGWTVMGFLGVVGLSLIGLGFLGSPQLFVRFLAMRDEAEIPAGTVVAIIWTLMADTGAVLAGMAGRALLSEPGNDVEALLGSGGENVLPLLVEHLFPTVVVGIYIAVVLSAIMSTVDSLLILAGSAAVRDLYQKVLHPEMTDAELGRTSRNVTIALATAAFALAIVVALLVPGRTVFWFVIFGWSGIAATFCPTMILSLGWRGMTRDGALAAMISGFLCVPLFKFGATAIPGIGVYFAELSELPPAFLISGTLGIVVSLRQKAQGRALANELDF
ncbi:MAG: sodium/proline symporter [Myxococcota bacterium]